MRAREAFLVKEFNHLLQHTALPSIRTLKEISIPLLIAVYEVYKQEKLPQYDCRDRSIKGQLKGARSLFQVIKQDISTIDLSDLCITRLYEKETRALIKFLEVFTPLCRILLINKKRSEAEESSIETSCYSSLPQTTTMEEETTTEVSCSHMKTLQERAGRVFDQSHIKLFSSPTTPKQARVLCNRLHRRVLTPCKHKHSISPRKHRVVSPRPRYVHRSSRTHHSPAKLSFFSESSSFYVSKTIIDDYFLKSLASSTSHTSDTSFYED